MWDDTDLSDSDLCTDIVRNTVFQRCRLLFSAHPESLFDFLDWIQERLVDDSVETSEGAPYGQVYRLSLNESVTFYFALLGAESVAKYSAKRCDNILLNGISSYYVNDDLIAFAAGLYASGKGLDALTIPKDFNTDYSEVWQTAVVESIFPQIARQIILNNVKS